MKKVSSRGEGQSLFPLNTLLRKFSNSSNCCLQGGGMGGGWGGDGGGGGYEYPIPLLN